MKDAERGAALIETALALPVILAALYGVTWAIRAGAVSERAEAAVRYAGVISAVQNPYHDYSLYALYNNLGPTSNVQTLLCAPPTNLYLKGGTLPVAIPGTAQTQRVMPSFWQPDADPQPFCDSTPGRQYFAGATRSYLLLQSVPAINTRVDYGGFFGATLFGSSVQTKDKFYRSPDIATLMHCANTLSGAVSSSLAPLKYGSSVGQLVQLQPGDFNSAPVGLNPNCTAGIGSQPIPPTPAPINFPTGSPPPTSPGNGGSPTPTPTPSVTKPPATPTPAPSPSPSPTAGASSTPNPGGSGIGGGTPTPTPSISPGPGNSATPVPPAPSASPTSAPLTPSPSKPPTTPKPTAPPTKAPTATPVPSPSPSGPPGSIS